MTESVEAVEIASCRHFRDALVLPKLGPVLAPSQQVAAVQEVVSRTKRPTRVMIGSWQRLAIARAEGQGCHSSVVVPLARQFLCSRQVCQHLLVGGDDMDAYAKTCAPYLFPRESFLTTSSYTGA